ncbi:hypothetical protein LCGC14_2785400 [marine sediment metagenome]|uniref:IclR-ED domain-containing protein n=1 Tax=marine sediment metagenome TaxID=412755 RepID=A0A0F8ZE67_9ZZZZ
MTGLRHNTIVESENYAEKDPLSGHYRRGPKIIDLALRFISNFNLLNLAHPILQNIVDQVNETTYLCFYTQQHLFFIDMVECAHAIRFINPLGQRPYMHAGAAGKIILAHLSANRLNQIISRGLPAFTPNTITDAEELKSELKKIRKEGCAFSSSEFAEGSVAFAGPILDSENTVIGCINIVIPVDRFNEEKKGLYPDLSNAITY